MITDGTVSFANDSWALLDAPGGRLQFQTVPGHLAPRVARSHRVDSHAHLDFYVADRVAMR